MDGAEFFRDTEFNVWSVSSILSSGDVAGLKFLTLVFMRYHLLVYPSCTQCSGPGNGHQVPNSDSAKLSNVNKGGN